MKQETPEKQKTHVDAYFADRFLGRHMSQRLQKSKYY